MIPKRVNDARVKALLDSGKSQSEVARMLGVDRSTITRAKHRLKLDECKPKTLSRAAILPMWLEGLTQSEIAKTVGMPIKTFQRRIQRMNLPERPHWTQRGKEAPQPHQVTPPKLRVPKAPTPPEEPPADTPETRMVADLLRTEGKWAALAEVAKTHGLTLTQAQQHYHRAVRG
jgi:transposase